MLNDQGSPVETITGKDIVGPWDLAVNSTATSAQLFVSNALGGNTTTNHGVPVTGNCTVVRLDLALSATAPPVLTSSTVIGSGYPWRANKAALVLAPTGLALGIPRNAVRRRHADQRDLGHPAGAHPHDPHRGHGRDAVGGRRP